MSPDAIARRVVADCLGWVERMVADAIRVWLVAHPERLDERLKRRGSSLRHGRHVNKTIQRDPRRQAHRRCFSLLGPHRVGGVEAEEDV